MEKKSVYAELLYIGFVTEKGRCKSKGIWKIGYRKQLYCHMVVLNSISNCLNDDEITEKDAQAIKDLFSLCNSEKEIKTVYYTKGNLFEKAKQNNFKIITSNDLNKSNLIINKLLIEITSELLKLLEKKLFLNKQKIYMLIRAAHNLPRYYFNEKEETLCGLCTRISISYQDAVEFSFSNMDEETRLKYEKLIKN